MDLLGSLSWEGFVVKHSFTSDSKQEYRDDCLDFLRTHGKSLVRDDRFSGHWCELAGQTGILTLNTLKDSGLILPNQFIGVDRSPQVIEECEAKEPGARWLVGSLLEVLPSIDDVSVLNFDSYRECGSDELLFDLDGLLSTITRAIRKYGSFVLFLNADLDSTKMKKLSSREALERHTRLVCKVFDGWLPGRKLDPDYLLRGSEILDSKYLGRIGDHYFIYRSKSHRMANLKLVFRLNFFFWVIFMKPSELSAELRRIAAALDNSKHPSKTRVASALKGLLSRVANDPAGDKLTNSDSVELDGEVQENEDSLSCDVKGLTEQGKPFAGTIICLLDDGQPDGWDYKPKPGSIGFNLQDMSDGETDTMQRMLDMAFEDLF